MINFNKVSKEYKTDFWKKSIQVLNQVNFNIPEGKLVGFLGPNGAGKTTSIKMLMGLTGISGGNIEYSEKLGKNKKEILSNIGYMTERTYFYPTLSASEFLDYVGKLNNIKHSELVSLKKKWSERLLIDHAMEHKIGTFSKGMSQRLGLIISLIHNPMMIVLDEPLSGLDPYGRKEFKEIFKEFKEQGKTVFFSSHIVSDIEEICDQLVVLNHGEVVFEGEKTHLIDMHEDKNYIIEVNGSKLFEEYLLKNGVYSVPPDKKDHFLKLMIDSDSEIVSLQRSRPTLEEVVYKVRNL
jgi:ABC-2 type transport system ATP-binding protein